MKYLLALVLAAATATGAVHAGINNPGGGSAVSVPAFNGSPNVTISAISTSGGIVTSRDSDGSTYQVPFFIQVSSSAITATGTSAPYEDLSYHWDFGDPSGVETFVRPTDGATVNADNGQNSPEAAYVYRTAGTYIITLTVSGCAGAVNSSGICGSLITTTVTKSVTVNTFGGADQYADQNGVASGQTGTLAHPWTTIAQINTALASGNVAMHVKRGSHWTGTAGILINSGVNVSNVRIDANFPGGVGANPVIEINSGMGNTPLQISNGGSSSPSNVKDVVLTNIDFKNSGSDNSGGAGVATVSLGNTSGSAVIQNVYFDSCNFNDTFDANSGVVPTVFGVAGTNDAPYLTSNIGWWNNSITNPAASTTIGIGLLGGAVNWNFFVGGSVSGGGTSNTFDHHIYPDVKNHSLYKWIAFGATGTGSHQRSFSINGNWDGPRSVPGTQSAQYHNYSENSFQFTSFGFDLGNAQNNIDPNDDLVQFQYVVVDGNAFNGTGGSLFACGLSVTIRDNRWWGSVGRGDWYAPVGTGQVASVAQTTHLLGKLYRNKLYAPAAAPSGFVFQFNNNGWTSPQVITYNMIVDARATGQIVQAVSADWLASGSVIDFNIYSETASYTTPWNNGAIVRTFGQWQAIGTSPNRWDASGTNLVAATPNGWTLPVTQWSNMGP